MASSRPVETEGARGMRGESAFSSSPPATSSERPSLGPREPSAHLATGPESNRHESGIYRWQKRRRRGLAPPLWPRAEPALEVFRSFSRRRRVRERVAVAENFHFFAFGREQRRNSAALLFPFTLLSMRRVSLLSRRLARFAEALLGEASSSSSRSRR